MSMPPNIMAQLLMAAQQGQGQAMPAVQQGTPTVPMGIPQPVMSRPPIQMPMPEMPQPMQQQAPLEPAPQAPGTNPAMTQALQAIMAMNQPQQMPQPQPLIPGRGTPVKSMGEILFGRKT